jgi:hypothetical protein
LNKEGYIYCFSNEAYNGILKIGMTERTPPDRARELYTTSIPAPFKIEFAKKVFNPKEKEATLHKLLTQYTERINPKREFFRASPEEVKRFFDLIDGELWIENPTQEDDDRTKSNDEKKCCSVISKCFTKHNKKNRENINAK